MLIRTDRAARACYRTDGGQIVYGFADSVVHARAPKDVAEVLIRVARALPQGPTPRIRSLAQAEGAEAAGAAICRSAWRA